MIADTAASYLMGNAMAMVEESCWNDDLKTLNTHVRQIATYVASNQKMSKFSKLGFQMACPLVDGVIDSDLCIEVQECIDRRSRAPRYTYHGSSETVLDR